MRKSGNCLIVRKVFLLVANLLSEYLRTEFKEMEDLNPLFAKGYALVDKQSLEVIDQGDIIADKEDMSNGGIVFKEECDLVNKDEGFPLHEVP
jgi:hypothetical protein